MKTKGVSPIYLVTDHIGFVYLLVEYLFYKSIDWKMVVVATILYGVLSVGAFKITDKTTKKK